VRDHPKLLVPGLLCAMATALIACSSDTADWAKASRDNTVAGYQSFIAAHPSDQHASEARAKLDALQNDQAWAEAQRAGTSDSYQTYLQHWPNGFRATVAHDQLARAAEWKSAQRAGTTTAIQAFLLKYQYGPEADQAKSRLRELMGYRVRLARASTSTEAERKRSQLQSMLQQELAEITVIPPDSKDRTYQIVSAAMSEEAARTVCDKVKRTRRTACYVVHE
jgi:hypothetical protein